MATEKGSTAETAAQVNQSTSGDKSPVINTDGGDATVNYGLKKEEYRQMLQEELARSLKGMQASGLAAEGRQLLEQQVKAAEEKLANLQQSYEEEIKRRRNAVEALGKLQGKLPEARIAAAQKSLEQGHTEAAEQIFDEVVDKEGSSVALATSVSTRRPITTAPSFVSVRNMAPTPM